MKQERNNVKKYLRIIVQQSISVITGYQHANLSIKSYDRANAEMEGNVGYYNKQQKSSSMFSQFSHSKITVIPLHITLIFHFMTWHFLIQNVVLV